MNCPKCNADASWIEQHQRWYCYGCQDYLPETAERPEEIVHTIKKVTQPGDKQYHYRIFFAPGRLLFVNDVSWLHVVGELGGPMPVFRTAVRGIQKKRIEDNSQDNYYVYQLLKQFPDATCIWKNRVESITLKKGGMFDASFVLNYPPEPTRFGKMKSVNEKYYFPNKEFDNVKAVFETYYADKLRS